MANLPKTEKLDLELNGSWLTVWFNSKENRNALSDQLTSELSETLAAVQDDRSVRGITLRGRHSIFCAGGDLKSFSASQGGGATHEAMATMNRGAGDLFDQIMGMPQVVIALVEGAAIAGGLGLMCCADVVAVTKDAKFSLTETMIGIPPAQIAPMIVARVGLPKARLL
ncbi:MAG: enoyl-CoA hydratase/isomerase family protein, partial [Acidimicrobiales bacterium]